MTNRIDPDFDVELDALERLSNGVLDLMEAGRLDEAESACRRLQHAFPDQMDWMERTAAVHEARGEIAQAIEHYEKCVGFIREHRDEFDPGSEQWYRDEAERLRGKLPA